MTPAESAFPELHPLIYTEMQILRRAKKVHVIGHDQIIPDQPCGRFCAPDVCQGGLHSGVCHPPYGVLCVDGDEENVGLPQVNVRPWNGRVATDVAMDAFAFGALAESSER